MDFILYTGLIILSILLFKAYRQQQYQKGRGSSVSFDRQPDDDIEENTQSQISKYTYKRRQYIMSKAENDFYKVLQDSLGSGYMIYPQAHLDLFLDHRTKGQSWTGALSTIQRKSVDFLICSREYYSPLVAIELDDASHQRPERVDRDAKLEEIFNQANMPLVRITWQYKYDANDILHRLSPYLN